VKEKAKKRAFDASIIEHDSCPKNETPSAARSFNNNFTATLTNTGNTSMWSTILQIQYEDYILTDDDVKVLHYKCQQFYTNVCDAVPDPIPCHLVNTLGQAHNETWHQQRWFRLTASSCKEAVTCKTNKSLTEYLKKTLLGLGKTQTAAMAYGIRHEQAAFDEYANRQSASNDTLSVEKSGMWVNGRYPGFGCSPDGLVEEAGNSGLLEIKMSENSAKYSSSGFE